MSRLPAWTLLALLPAAAAQAGAPLRVYLEPVDETVVQPFPAGEVERTLRKRLLRHKSIALVDAPEHAALTLRVRECVGWGEKVTKQEVEDRKIKGPSGKGIVFGGEGYYGVSEEKRALVVMTVRATWPDHFTDLQAADDDRTLKAAADSVAAELDRLVKRKLSVR